MMMTLTEIVLLMNRSKKLIALFCLTLLLGAIGIQLYQQRELPAEKIAAPSLSGDELPPSVQLKSGLKSPAKWMDVYRIVESDVPLTKDWAGAVAKKFGFTSPPKVAKEENFLWSSKEKWLSLDKDHLRYGLDLLSNPSLVGDKSENLSSEQQAAEIVRQFLVEKGFNTASRLTSLETSLVAIRSARWLDVDEESEADAFRLDMSEKIEDIPILEPGTEGVGSLVAYVGWEGKILKLSYSWGERDYQVFDRYPLRGLDDGLTDGKVIEVTGEGLEGMTIELQTLYVTSVSLGYFADSSSGFVYPVFVFQGTGSAKEGKSFQVTVLAPAISSKWLVSGE